MRVGKGNDLDRYCYKNRPWEAFRNKQFRGCSPCKFCQLCITAGARTSRSRYGETSVAAKGYRKQVRGLVRDTIVQ